MEGLEEIFVNALKDAPTFIILIFFAGWSVKRYIINGLQEAVKTYLEKKIEYTKQTSQAAQEIVDIVKQMLDNYNLHTQLLQEIAAGVGGRRKDD